MSVKKVYERVVDENEELCGKMLLLGELIYNGKRPKSISKYQWKLLKKQLKAMQKYQRILGARLEDLYCQAFNEAADNNKAKLKAIDSDGNPFPGDHPVITPGQEKPGHDYLPDAKIQSAKDFMKDDNE